MTARRRTPRSEDAPVTAPAEEERRIPAETPPVPTLREAVERFIQPIPLNSRRVPPTMVKYTARNGGDGWLLLDVDAGLLRMAWDAYKAAGGHDTQAFAALIGDIAKTRPLDYRQVIYMVLE